MLENVPLAPTRGIALWGFCWVAWLWTPHQGQKGTNTLILNPCLSMVSPISGFKGTQSSDLFVVYPRASSANVACLEWCAWTTFCPLLFFPGSSFSVHVGGRWIGLGWEEDEPGPFHALLLSHWDLVLTKGLGEHVPMWLWAALCSSMLPSMV